MQTYSVPISVKGIVFEGDAVWLRKNERNEWELPGGKLDEREQPVEAVQREMKEELGFDVEVGDIVQSRLYTIQDSADESHGVFVVSYRCTILHKTGEFELRGEAGSAQFYLCPFEEIATLNMPEFYKEAIYNAQKGRQAVTVDCVVFDGQDRLLLIRRKNYPYEGMYALPGGFVEDNETVEEGAQRELFEETGIQAESLQFIGVYSRPGRDPRRRTITIAYLVVPQNIDTRAGDDAASAEFVQEWHGERLAFDHDQIVADAVRLRKR